MPKTRVCAEPQCPTLTSETFCDEHQRSKRQAADQRRATARSHYGGARWRAVRRTYLRHHPLCECGCGRIATVVHHLDGKGLHGPDAYNPTNLMAMAKACHDRITAADHGGWQRAR